MQTSFILDNSKYNFYIKTNNLIFSLLVLVCILDPSNTILKSKEILFIIFCLHGILNFYNKFNLYTFSTSFFLAIIFPICFIIVGKYSNYYYSFDIALDYFKVFLFLLLINFLLNTNINYNILFSQLTMVLIPISILIYVSLLQNKFELIESFIGDYTKTVMIANRDFGNLNFAMVYYKTVSLLIFGLAYQLSLPSNFRRTLLTFLAIFILILSATRANIFSLFFLIIINIYYKFFSLNTNRKVFFFSILFSSILMFSNYFVSTFFDKNEDSIIVKFGFISDYILTFNNNPSIYFFGQGLGSGLITNERGLSYNLETTYLELIRIFGLFGSFFIFLLLISPLIFSLFKNVRNKITTSDRYFFLAYFCYVFIIIPSNPLLLSSTGMIVMVVTYTLINRINKLNFKCR